jgi:predicted site-specific integrase-resolvase
LTIDDVRLFVIIILSIQIQGIYMSALLAGQAAKHFGVSAVTLRRWEKAGLIQTSRAPSGHRIYYVDTLLPATSLSTTPINSSNVHCQIEEKEKVSYIYARVSSRKQRSDLERQITALRTRYPRHVVIQDIGSGINFKRPGLTSLLERSRAGLVREIVFTHRDRLCRFAYDLLEQVFHLNSTNLVVVFPNSSPTANGLSELVEDILAINTVYICRMQGRRAAENRRARTKGKTKEAETDGYQSQEEEEKGQRTVEDSEDTVVSQCIAESSSPAMDGLC